MIRLRAECYEREVPRVAIRTREDPLARTRLKEAVTQPHAQGGCHVPARSKERAHALARTATHLRRACMHSHAPRRGLTLPHAPKNGGHALAHAEDEGHEPARCHTCATLALIVDFDWAIKRDCPNYKAHDQSSDTAATTVMAVDEDEDKIDVLLAISKDKKLDWISNNTASRFVGKESVQFCMADERFVTLTKWRSYESFQGKQRGNKEMLWGKKTKGLYRLKGSVQIGRAIVRHGSDGISKNNGQGKQPLHKGMKSKRKGTWGSVMVLRGSRAVQEHREMLWDMCKNLARVRAGGEMEPQQFTLVLISGGDLSSCAHKERKRDRVTTIRKVTYCAAHLSWGCRAHRSYGGVGSEAIRIDNLKASDYPPAGLRGKLLSPTHLDESKSSSQV
ncbi:hypothetical protein Acr_15g0001120 [Actinidia rufa]|uniref:Uncharacterized protein n=1 Tax=Actinidia rufa TaxID=165716 RepID=A0A7J0FS45_9ERIC|nr:hypothetical protein Acr_15g0001120 [Actinidia rufa]